VKNKKLAVILVAVILGVSAVVVFFGPFRSTRDGHGISKEEEKLVKTFYEEYNDRNFAYLYYVLFGSDFRENTPYARFEALQRNIHDGTGEVLEWELVAREAREHQGMPIIHAGYRTVRERENTVDEFVLMERDGIWTIENMVQQAADR
jgi:hypothetical protein